MSLFKSQTNLFKEIACPLGSECKLGNCIYSHKPAPKPAKPVRDDTATAGGTTPTTLVKRSATPALSSVLFGDAASKKQKVDASIPLVPKIVDNPPVQHRQRVQFVNVIRDKLNDNGYKQANSRAIELECEVAQRCTRFTYPMGIRSLVREITTKQLDNDAEREAQEARTEAQIYRSELVNLLVPIRELEKARFVLAKPDRAELDSTRVMPCARCSTTFPIYNSSTTTTSCRFHLLKRVYDPEIKKLSPTYPCCGETVDQSSGCEVRDFHVYKFEAPSDMEAVLPFRVTPSNPEHEGEFAVGLDCEMAWTTKGFELIRVTVVSYATNKTVYDRLVWPLGKILDLNTRFSGVANMDDGIQVDGQRFPPLSRAEMYTQLFKLITAKTIIIGHGLVNDMNALRLIHHRIVDTAILFPRIRHRTHSLKELAWDFLSREIQTGEHDSMEDSLAAIDIVKQDIKNRCFQKTVKSFK